MRRNERAGHTVIGYNDADKVGDVLTRAGAPGEEIHPRPRALPAREAGRGETRTRSMSVPMKSRPRQKRLFATVLVLCCGGIVAADAPEKKADPAPKALPRPTLANVPYGTHERQVLDFYKAEAARPTPLVFFIHGGGWVAGDKSGMGSVAKCLD